MKNKLRVTISILLYVVASFSLFAAITATSNGSLIDFTSLARLVFCGLAIICVIAATLVWKSRDARDTKVKIIVMAVAIAVIVGGGLIDTFCATPGQVTIEYVSIQPPFEASEVESIDAYHYYSNPAEAEKKTITDPESIAYLYEKICSLLLQNKDVKDQATHNVTIFRFNLADGTDYSIIYTGYGVKNGEIKTSGGSNYFTTSDIGGIWNNIPVEPVQADESELPVVNITPSSQPIITE